MGEGAGEPFAATAVEAKNALAGLGNLEKNPVNHQSARIGTKVVWFVRCRDEDVPGHKGVFFIDGIEDEIALEAEAELHAAGMVMEVGPLPDGMEVAEAENGNAADAIRAKVKDPIARFVAIGYSVGHHLVRIIADNPVPMGYKKIIEKIIPTCHWDVV